MIGAKLSEERKNVDEEKLYEANWGGGKQVILFWECGRS
jgi:hypothetical protein